MVHRYQHVIVNDVLYIMRLVVEQKKIGAWVSLKKKLLLTLTFEHVFWSLTCECREEEDRSLIYDCLSF